MKLYYSPPSPFSRKARIVVRVLDLEGRVEEEAVRVNPIETNEGLIARNPLVKVPILETDNIGSLFDSRVICAYLDAVALSDRRVFPHDGDALWQEHRAEALCDGILDAAVLANQERNLRPEGVRWEPFREAQLRRVRRGLAALEDYLAAPHPRLHIGEIAAVCVLGYLDLRIRDIAWRADHPAITRWFESLRAAPGIEATQPQ
jgi:glutathione S-transferase